jgi:prepilin-type processing-associated H-X9-DG protein
MFAIAESRFRQETTNANPADGVSSMFCGYLTRQGGRPISLPARHGKNYNQLYCDGHVAALDPWFLFDPNKSAVMWNNDHQPHRELWPPN